MKDLELRIDEVCESMKSAETEFNQATQCLVEVLTAINERLERIESWIKSQVDGESH